MGNHGFITSIWETSNQTLREQSFIVLDLSQKHSSWAIVVVHISYMADGKTIDAEAYIEDCLKYMLKEVMIKTESESLQY